jgi:MFS family permease
MPAAALWALLPLLARTGLGLSAIGYGALLGCLGVGAIVGALGVSRVRAQVSSDRLVVIATIAFAAVSAGLAVASDPVVAGAILLLGGVAWMAAMATLNVAAQNAVPAWVRARALAVGLLAVQGGLAFGSLLWGAVATRAGIPWTLVAGAVLLLAGAAATTRFVLHGLSNLDLRPDPRWTLPQTACDLDGDEGPVLVTLEYHVAPEDAEAFVEAVRRIEPIRRRDGAIRWNVYHDTEDPTRWVETFVVESWLEHLRQHERITASDRIVLDAARRFHRGGDEPRVRHHIAAPRDGRPIGPGARTR